MARRLNWEKAAKKARVASQGSVRQPAEKPGKKKKKDKKGETFAPSFTRPRGAPASPHTKK